jgi:hypothetical protein
MTVQALHHVRAMKGHTRPHLMLCDDNEIYVVKFRRNLHHSRQLASEYIATRLARWVGLPAPECSAVYVPQFLMDNTPELRTQLNAIKCAPGFHLCSRFVGGLDAGPVMDMLPQTYLHELTNGESFAGILAFDKWCSNTGRRQAVFHRTVGSRRYTAYFIDQGDCFCGDAWAFSDLSDHGLFDQRSVYRDITGWDSFEPFITRLASIRPEVVWDIALQVPPEWYGGQMKSLEELIDSLLVRRSRIHQLIANSRDRNPQLFPGWMSKTYAAVLPRPRAVFASLSVGMLNG